jgi:thiol-disulfide isomerase/thioredoxin
MHEEMAEEPLPAGGGKRMFHWLLLAAVVAVFMYALLRPAGRNEHAGAIGATLHRLQLAPLTGGGEPVELQNLQGRVTVINFWGTWCPPCREELPHVVALNDRFRKREPFQLFAVSCGSGYDSDLAELTEETTAFLRQQEFELPTYADPEAVTRMAVLEILGGTTFSYPTTLVLDKSGVIRGVWIGYMPGEERDIEALVEKLLAGQES